MFHCCCVMRKSPPAGVRADRGTSVDIASMRNWLKARGQAWCRWYRDRHHGRGVRGGRARGHDHLDLRRPSSAISARGARIALRPSDTRSRRSACRRILCILACLGPSIGALAQEFASEHAIGSAATALKLALPIKASRLSILSADRAIWEDGDANTAVVERSGPCVFGIKPASGPGLRIDFSRLSVPVQHACGTEACTVRLSGIERAVCVTSAAPDQCKGFLQLGPLPVASARELLASIVLVHQTAGCTPLNRR
jgi:hypothetical protein